MASKDLKILLIGIAITFLAILGGSFLVSSIEPTDLGVVDGVAVSPQPSNWGDVGIDGGIVTKDFIVTNETSNAVTLKKIATSCMCTEAKVVYGDKETKFFGMEHPGDRNALVSLKIPQGESAVVVVNFDPAAHGPEGVGPFERVVELTFSDPAGIKEIVFDGRVIR